MSNAVGQTAERYILLDGNTALGHVFVDEGKLKFTDAATLTVNRESDLNVNLATILATHSIWLLVP